MEDCCAFGGNCFCSVDLDKISMSSPIIIFGSSRDNGSTYRAILHVLEQYGDMPVINLNDLNISAFDYEHKNNSDDFLPLIKKVLEHDTIILATPIYWYTMSAIMKVFIDRWSDLTTIHKDLGRKMRGKAMQLITSYYVHPEGKKGFEGIFKQTAEYMGMQYGSCYYYYSGEDKVVSENNQKQLEAFIKQL